MSAILCVDDDDIFGDGVNVAARLESNFAGRGGICISDVVYKQVNGRVEAGSPISASKL
jgi:adenylate cyclase